MKKTYEKPQIELLDLLIKDELSNGDVDVDDNLDTSIGYEEW